jgi:hypothetical protein
MWISLATSNTTGATHTAGTTTIHTATTTGINRATNTYSSDD